MMPLFERSARPFLMEFPMSHKAAWSSDPLFCVGRERPSPQVVPFPAWKKACDRACAALLAGESRVLVVGAAGTGKTALLDQVGRVLRSAGWEVTTRLAGAEIGAVPNGPQTALLVDEADRMPREALRRLLKSTSGPLVLAGLGTLTPLVRAGTAISLAPLDPEAARSFVAQWLALTGRAPAQLEPAASSRAIELSGGVPRLLSSLLAAAAWLADSAGEQAITRLHIDDAGSLRACLTEDDPDAEESAAPPPLALRRATWAPLLMGMVLLGAGGFATARTWPAKTQQTVDLVQSYAVRLGPAISSRFAMPPAPTLAMSPEPAGSLAVPVQPAAEADGTRLAEAPAPAQVEAAAPVFEAPVPAQMEAEAPPAMLDTMATDTAISPEQAPAPVAEPGPAAMADSGPPQLAAEPAAEAAAEPATEPGTSLQTASAAPEPQPLPMQIAANEPESPQADHASVAEPAREQPAVPKAVLAMLMQRGQEMLSIGDLSAARLLFGRAAEAGDKDAMLAMGGTFDPVALAGASSLLIADRAEAMRWYGLAAAAGSAEASARMQRLNRQAAR